MPGPYSRRDPGAARARSGRTGEPAQQQPDRRFSRGVMPFFDTIGDYLVPDFIEDWWNEPSASERLEAERDKIPGAPGISPQARGYMDILGRGLQQPLGAGYKSTPYYKQLQSDITQQMRGRRRAYGASAAGRGALTMGGMNVGAGQRAATEQSEVEGRLRLAADAQARQQVVAEQISYYDQLSRASGFEQGMLGQDFQQQYQVYLANKDLTQQEIRAEMEKLQMWLGLIGGGAAAYAQYEASQAKQ